MQISFGIKRALSTAVAVTIILATWQAGANGRFPRGEQIIEFPSNTNRIILAATYGLVSTDDGGKNWYYICETAFSHYPPPSATEPGYNGDPLLALTTDDAILGNVQERVTKSTDAACGWTKSLELPGAQVVDIAVAPSSRNIAVALVKSVNAIQVYQSMDAGATWNPIGSPLTNVADVYTIDIDPKDPMHLMVTGIRDYDPIADTGVLLNSTNRAMTWASFPIPKTNLMAPPYIAAVHPNDPKVIFVRTDEWVDNDIGGYDARDALIYTKDGGQTWTQLLRPIGPDGPGAKLFGFALSPDGTTVLAGFGDPVDGSGRTVDRALTGIYKSSGPDYSFGATPMPTYVESVTCITWTAKGVYVCGSPDGATSYIGFARDANNLTTSGITKIMEVTKLTGEPPCCAGRAVSTCDWSAECVRFLACGDSGAPPPTPAPDAAVCMMPDAGKEGGAGAGGSAGEAGTGTSTGGASGAGTGGAGRAGAAGTATGGAGTGGATTGGSGGAGTGGTGGGDNGCNCSMASASDKSSLTSFSLLLGLIGANRWRRSRRRETAASTGS